MKLLLCGCALLLASTTVSAQTTSPIAAPVVTGAVLRTGTEVPLKLSEMLTTKGKVLKAGQRIHLEVAEPVLVNGVVVIPAGSPAMGEITEVRNKGMWGKSGHFAGRVLYTTVNGRQLRLTGVFDDKGTAGGVGAVAASAVLIPVAGFFMTGTSAKLDIGTPVKGFMDEDVPLAMAASGPAPMSVGTTAPAATPTAELRTISTTPVNK
jgi:hypothetical protein